VDDRGQASIEWLGVVALVAAVVLALGVAAGGGAEAAAAVVRQMHHALCIVSGGVCDLDRRPCVVGSAATIDQAHVNLGIWRIGRDELILRERRSDGSVLVTFLHDTSAGVDVGLGVDVWVRAGGLDMAYGNTARAALLLSIGGGESWLFANGRDADSGMAYLSEHRTPPAGHRAQRIQRAGAGVELSAHGGNATDSAGGGLEIDGRILTGAVFDEASGRTTHVISVDGSAAAAGLLEVEKTDTDAGGQARAVGELRVAVTSDADGRPLELSVVRTGQLDGSASLPKVVQGIAEQLVGSTAGGLRWMVEQRLDLTDPANLAATRSLVDALAHPLSSPAALAAAWNDRLATAGVTEASTYSVGTDDGGGGGVHIAAGIKLGGGVEDRTERGTLVDARVRGADGVWRRRSECLTSAAMAQAAN
jgi:hypothetical protein